MSEVPLYSDLLREVVRILPAHTAAKLGSVQPCLFNYEQRVPPAAGALTQCTWCFGSETCMNSHQTRGR